MSDKQHDDVQADVSPEHISELIERGERGELLTGQDRRDLRVFNTSEIFNPSVEAGIVRLWDRGRNRILHVLGSNTPLKVEMAKGSKESGEAVDVEPLKDIVKRRKLYFVPGTWHPRPDDDLIEHISVGITSNENGKSKSVGSIEIDADTGEVLEDNVSDSELRPVAEYVIKAMQFHRTGYPVYGALDSHVSMKDAYNLGTLYRAADEWREAEKAVTKEQPKEERKQPNYAEYKEHGGSMTETDYKKVLAADYDEMAYDRAWGVLEGKGLPDQTMVKTVAKLITVFGDQHKEGWLIPEAYLVLGRF